MNIIHGTLDIPGDPTPWLTVQPNDQKDYCLLWLQGWTSTIEKHEPLITRLAEQTGVTFAMLNYAGHGNHPVALEETTREQQFDEALFAYDALKAEGYKHIIVAGTSFGGYLTALLVAKRTPYTIILRAPAIYEDDEFSMSFLQRNARKDRYQTFKKTVMPSSKLSVLTNVRNYPGWTYVIEHEIDTIIPANIPRAYFDVTQHGNYLIIPATDHSPARMPEPEKHFRYIETLLGNLLNLIKFHSTLEK